MSLKKDMVTGRFQDLLARKDANFSQYMKDRIKYSKFVLEDTKQNQALFQEQYLKDHEQEVELFATKLYIKIRENNKGFFNDSKYGEKLSGDLCKSCMVHATAQIAEDAAHLYKQIIKSDTISQMQYIKHLELTKGAEEVVAFKKKEKIIIEKIEKIKYINIKHLELTKGQKEAEAFKKKEKIIIEKMEYIKEGPSALQILIKEGPGALQILSDLQNWIKCWWQKLTKNSLDDIEDYNHAKFTEHYDAINDWYKPYEAGGNCNVSISSSDE